MNEEEANLPSLPEGWEWSSFVDLAANKANALKAGPFGSALKKSSYVSAGFKVYGQEQVIRNDPCYGDYYISEDKFNEFISCSVEPKDILISLVGTIGKVLVLPDDIKPGIINPRLVKLSLDRRITLSEYIKLYIESRSVKKYFSMVSHGGTMEILNLKILKLLPVPTPPLNEQRRIVEKIEALTDRSRKARAALDQIPALLDQFRQSVLAAAFRGDLTADWRAQNPDVETAEALLERIRVERRQRWEKAELEKMKAKGTELQNDKWKSKYKEPELVDLSELPELPSGWKWASAMQACEEVFLGLTSKVDYVDSDGVPLVRAGDIHNGVLSFSKARNISITQHENLTRYRKARRGDILVSKSGSLGTCAIVDTDQEFSIYESIIVLQPSSILLNRFLLWLLRSPDVQRRMLGNTVGSTVGHLNLLTFRDLPMPIAPLEVTSQ